RWSSVPRFSMVSPIGCDSLSVRRMPELDFVALGVDDPPELSELGIVRLFEYVAALAAQRLQEALQIGDPVVDHEGRLAGREMVAVGAAHRPDRRARNRIAGRIGPAKRGASPRLHVDAEMPLVPGLQRSGIP